MATLLFARRGAPRALTIGLGLSSAFAASNLLQMRSRPLLCESIGEQASNAFRSYQRDAKVPVVKADGKVNRGIYRQISSGSILGLIGGLAVSTFSKTLTVLIGMFVAGTQYLESMGLHVVPTGKIQRYFKGIDVRSAVEDNVAFKITFGATFALAAFAQF